MVVTSPTTVTPPLESQAEPSLSEPRLTFAGFAEPIYFDAVTVTIAPFPWDSPQYVVEAEHVESCARFLRQVADSSRQAPQSSVQAEQIQTYEDRVWELESQNATLRS